MAGEAGPSWSLQNFEPGDLNGVKGETPSFFSLLALSGDRGGGGRGGALTDQRALEASWPGGRHRPLTLVPVVALVAVVQTAHMQTPERSQRLDYNEKKKKKTQQTKPPGWLCCTHCVSQRTIFLNGRRNSGHSLGLV